MPNSTETVWHVRNDIQTIKTGLKKYRTVPQACEFGVGRVQLSPYLGEWVSVGVVVVTKQVANILFANVEVDLWSGSDTLAICVYFW